MKKALRKLTRLSTGQMGVAFVDAETGEILPHPLPEDYEAVGQDGSKLSEIEVAETEEAIAETEELDQDPNNTNTDSDHVTIGGNGKSPLKGATLKTPFKGLRNIFSKDEEVQDYVGKDTYPAAPKKLVGGSDTETVGVPYKYEDENKPTMPEGWEGPDQVRSWLNTDEGKEASRRRALDEPYEEKAYYTEDKEAPTPSPNISYEEAKENTGLASLVSYNNQGAKRNQNLSPKLEALISKAMENSSKKHGVEIKAIVTSGGQYSKAQLKSGEFKGQRPKNASPRHDYGHAGDFKFEVDGRRLDMSNSSDRNIMSSIIEESVALGATGVGGAPNYMGLETLHIGFGNYATWGKRGEAASPFVTEAWKKGKKRFDPNQSLQVDVPIPSERYDQAEQRNIDPLTTDLNGNPPLSKEYWSDSAIEGSNAPQVVDVPQEYWSDSALAGQEQTTSQNIINEAKAVGNTNSVNLSNKNVEQMIRDSASARGIDPEVAVQVAKAEGLGGSVDYTTGWRSNVTRGGTQEPSYGPFQLLVGKDEEGYGPGLGDEFIAKTGLDPRDPNTVSAQINFALDHAANNGWGSWYGANKVTMPQGSGLTTARAIGWQNTTPEQRWDYSSNQLDIPIPAPTPKYEDSYTPLGSTLSYGDNSSLVSAYQDYGNSRVQSNESTTTGYTPSSTTPYEDNSSLVSAYQDYGSSRTQGDESATTGYTPSSTTPYEDNSSLVSAYQDYGNSRSVSDRGQSIKEQLASARDEINDFKNPIDNQPSSNSYEDNPSLVSAYQDYGNSRAESEKEENSKSVDSKPSGSIGDMLGSWF